ncbi:MAG: hypothetical protein ACR2JG_01100 [Geodermatophilaceae bacterium]
MTQPSPWRIAGQVLAWVALAFGFLGALLGLMLLLSASGPHGYTNIFGGLLLIVSIPVLLTGLLAVLPKRAALWLSRILAVLGVLLIVWLLIELNSS